MPDITIAELAGYASGTRWTRPHRPVQNARDAAIVQQYLTSRETLREIGARYGISDQRVRQVVRAAGVPGRHTAQPAVSLVPPEGYVTTSAVQHILADQGLPGSQRIHDTTLLLRIVAAMLDDPPFVGTKGRHYWSPRVTQEAVRIWAQISRGAVTA